MQQVWIRKFLTYGRERTWNHMHPALGLCSWENSLLFLCRPTGVNTPKWRSCPAARSTWKEAETGSILDVSLRKLTFWSALSLPDRKPSSEEKEERDIMQTLHSHSRYLLVSFLTDPSTFILRPQNCKVLWSLTSVFKSLFAPNPFWPNPEPYSGKESKSGIIGNFDQCNGL